MKSIESNLPSRPAPVSGTQKRRIGVRQLGALAILLSVAASLAGCEGMTTRQRDTALGAGAGGLAGAALGGGVLGTVGGAAAGGIIGNQIGK